MPVTCEQHTSSRSVSSSSELQCSTSEIPEASSSFSRALPLIWLGWYSTYCCRTRRAWIRWITFAAGRLAPTRAALIAPRATHIAPTTRPRGRPTTLQKETFRNFSKLKGTQRLVACLSARTSETRLLRAHHAPCSRCPLVDPGSRLESLS